MSRALDRALRPADGPAPVRPRLPARFEPGLDLRPAAAGPERLSMPELAGEEGHQGNPGIWNGPSWLSQAASDLASGEAQDAEPAAPATAAPATGASATGALGSTRMPSHPVQLADGTDATKYPLVGPPTADAAGWPPVSPLALGVGEVTPAGAAWSALPAESPTLSPARDPARAMMVPLAQRLPAPGRRPAAAPRLHRDARQHGVGQHGVGQHGVGQHGVDQHGVDQHGVDQHGLDRDSGDWDSAGQHGAYEGSPGQSSVTQGSVTQGSVTQGSVTQGSVRPGAAEPVVRISIGRVEIRADRADAPRPQRPAARPRQPALDLAEYLRRRGGQR